MKGNKTNIKHDCPCCLNSSGTVADGRGTKCKSCNGTGLISLTLYRRLYKEYGDLIKKPPTE